MRAQAVERIAIGVKFISPLLSDLGQWAFFFLSLTDGAIVNVGEVAHMLDLLGPEFELEQASDDVVDDEGAKVADVRRGVDRGAAIVEAYDAVGLRRSDRFEATLKRIVKLDSHEQSKRKRD